MEGAVLDNPDVRTMIEDNFVVIKLMVDEKKKLPVPETVTENGKNVVLETYGDRWSYLQRRHKCTYPLQRSTPQPGHKVYGKRQ